MSNIASAGDLLRDTINEGTGGVFLSKEEKEALFASATAFYVVGAEPCSDGRFGLQTHFYVRSKEAFGDDVRNLSFTHNKFREALAKNIVAALANGMQAAGPFWLGKFSTSSGHTAWDMLAEKPSETMAGIATPAAPAAAGNAPTDDSLPF